MRVGELARETGLTVRTLHHYDEIGLLSPSRRSESGYRLYGREDIARLQQIRSLRQLGFPLDEIRSLLDGSGLSPLQIVELHLRRLREGLALQQTLVERLEALSARLAADEEPGQAELVRAIEVMTMTEQVNKYYTPEQLEQLERRRHIVGEDRIREVEAEWPQLMAEMRAELERGTDPADARVQELARRWKALVEEFTGGDPEIRDSLQRMYGGEPQVRERAGIDPDLTEYVGRAMEAGRSGR
jgi:DNA-binding transcriptional MerR regulator